MKAGELFLHPTAHTTLKFSRYSGFSAYIVAKMPSSSQPNNVSVIVGTATGANGQLFACRVSGDNRLEYNIYTNGQWNLATRNNACEANKRIIAAERVQFNVERYTGDEVTDQRSINYGKEVVTSGLNRVFVGGIGSSSQDLSVVQPWHGIVHEVIYYNKFHTAAESKIVLDYLRKKWEFTE